jgi:type VI protein secretion system component Hcp
MSYVNIMEISGELRRKDVEQNNEIKAWAIELIIMEYSEFNLTD